ncbi:hypothetical protein OOU_Y34scaffold00831g5, partial [Pyricularia oryzae Y34]
HKPLPEDWAMRGLVWAETAFPERQFKDANVLDENERAFETPSMLEERRQRCLWLGYQVAQLKRWITYDSETKRFRPAAQYVKAEPAVAASSVLEDVTEAL